MRSFKRVEGRRKTIEIERGENLYPVGMQRRSRRDIIPHYAYAYQSSREENKVKVKLKLKLTISKSKPKPK